MVILRNIKGFLIYDPKSKKFSSGGSYPTWNQQPRIWSSLRTCKSHLNTVVDRMALRIRTRSLPPDVLPEFCGYENKEVVVVNIEIEEPIIKVADYLHERLELHLIEKL